MRRLVTLVLLCAALAGGAVGLAQDRPDPTQPTPEPPSQPAPARTPEDEARRARVLARIGEARVTLGDVEDQIASQSPFVRERFRDPAEIRALAEQMIRFELLARAAEKKGYATNPEVVRTVAQNAVQQLVRRDFDERITVESIPEADVQAYYAAHPDEFHRAEMRRASHILLATREEAEALIAEVRDADARVFRQLARDRSLDEETKMRGGDLRYFARERTPDAPDAPVEQLLVDAAFSLHEVGDVVAHPVQIGTRFSVLKLTGMRPEENRSVEESAPAIRMRLWRERRQTALDGFVADLRTRLAPELHEDRVERIRLDPPEDLAPGFPSDTQAPAEGAPAEAPAQPAAGATPAAH